MRWKWVWNFKAAEVYLIVKFVAFGPFMLLIHSNQNVGSIIFADNPFAYFMINALVVATLAVCFMFVVDSFLKKKYGKVDLNIFRYLESRCPLDQMCGILCQLSTKITYPALRYVKVEGIALS